MDTNKMREQFEAWAACSAWLGLGEESQLHRDAEGTGYNEIEVHTAWLAWQASRAAVVVELPSFEGYKDHIVRELQAAFSGAIERQGLKVAP